MQMKSFKMSYVLTNLIYLIYLTFDLTNLCFM
jgi:hypothetical protein